MNEEYIQNEDLSLNQIKNLKKFNTLKDVLHSQLLVLFSLNMFLIFEYHILLLFSLALMIFSSRFLAKVNILNETNYFIYQMNKKHVISFIKCLAWFVIATNGFFLIILYKYFQPYINLKYFFSLNSFTIMTGIILFISYESMHRWFFDMDDDKFDIVKIVLTLIISGINIKYYMINSIKLFKLSESANIEILVHIFILSFLFYFLLVLFMMLLRRFKIKNKIIIVLSLINTMSMIVIFHSSIVYNLMECKLNSEKIFN